MADIAVFPIPNSVCFPGMVVPLHVFEPRYRAMVNHCVEEGMHMAVTHTESIIRQAPASANVEEALNRNAATYKPHSVFSAGPCAVKETLPDGRILVEISMEQRFQSIEIIQRLPFEIHRCSAFDDVECTPAELNESALLKEKIMTRLKALCAKSEEMVDLLSSKKLADMPAKEFSFYFFQWVRFDSALQQTMLEQQSPTERLAMFLDILNEQV